MTALELYGTASCPYTAELRADLVWRRVEFVEYDVDADAAARERLFALIPQAPRSVPVLVEEGRVIQVGWQGRGCAVLTQ
jgi:glutaredoxin 3